MTIRMLTPACAESKRLIDWVETGESTYRTLALQQPAPFRMYSAELKPLHALQACTMHSRSASSRCAEHLPICMLHILLLTGDALRM